MEEIVEVRDWSQLPAEILGTIFSYLERKCDLLSGRLVCRSWNQECLRLLQKPDTEFNTILTEEGIHRYLNLISDGDIPQLILPFHLYFTIEFRRIPRSSLMGLMVRDPTSDSDTDSDSELGEIKLNNIITHVESLCAVFGEECIQKLTLKSVPEDLSTSCTINPEDKINIKIWLIKFLKKVSSGLKMMDLNEFAWRLGSYTEDEVKSKTFKISELNFPKLKTLICYNSIISDNLEFFSQTSHHIYEYIVKYSPNLENLKEIETKDLIQLPKNFGQLKSLRINQLDLPPIQLLDKLRQSTNAPVLEVLGFNIWNWKRMDKIEVLHSILEYVSINLKSLRVSAPQDDMLLERFMTFCSFPNLQRLRIEKDTENILLVDPEETNFNPETLPMLKSVELPLGLILSNNLLDFENQNSKVEVEVPVKFTNVNDLTILLSDTFWFSEIGLQKGLMAMKYLLYVFPNITKLSIRNEWIRGNKQEGVKDLLKSFIQSPLTTNIREIYIDGFAEDVLGQVLEQMETLPRSQAQHFLRNVRKIGLGLPEHIFNLIGSHDPLSPIPSSTPNLNAMAKYFPVLQIIEISEHLFRDMCGEEEKELIQRVRTTFPYLWVHVTTDPEFRI